MKHRNHRHHLAWLLAMAAAVGVALPLEAAEVAISPATIAAPLQASLHDRYGAAEGAVLQQMVSDWLTRSLKAAGASVAAGAPVRIEVSIDDAVPSHPTRYQIEHSPGLDPLRSISLGGARLHAVLRDAGGQVLDQVEYDRYATSLHEVSPSGDAWGDARVTIERFSELVAKSWQRHAAH